METITMNQGSSLIWVHVVCNIIGNKSESVDEKADNINKLQHVISNNVAFW